MKLSFYGAAGEVTGSCYLVEAGRSRVLVDFGLHQGHIGAEARNRRMPPILPERLNAVVLTHGHLDHCGRLPLLAKAGYTGPIYTTPTSLELTDIILKDSANIQESDAERQNRDRAAQGKPPVPPLYTTRDAEATMRLFRPLDYDTPLEIAPGIRVRLVDAGHILGSASVEMTVTERGQPRVLAFSGDIGVEHSPLLRDPVYLDRADFVVMESTYGDRDHKDRAQSVTELATVLEQAQSRGGKVLIPAFAVGRTQELIYHMADMSRHGRMRGQKVYIDSPMATTATQLYKRHREVLDEDTAAIISGGNTPLDFPELHFTQTPQESAALNPLDGGIVVIAGSGMCTGGRILHHLKHNLDRPGTCLVFVGFQAEGTLGRRLVDGAKAVRVMGQDVIVRANVHTIGGFSAHAGQSGLMKWAASFKGARPRFFLTHGEPPIRLVLGAKLSRELGLAVGYPMWGDTVEL